MRRDTRDRQWRLLARLEARRRGASVAELAEALEASPRTVYRDLEALKDAGVPLAPERDGPTTRWRLTTAPAPVGSPAPTLGEAAAVVAAAAAVGPTAPFAALLAAARAKARSAVPGVDLDAVTGALTDLAEADGAGTHAAHLALLAEALDSGRALQVRYQPLGHRRPLTRRLHALALRRHVHGLLLFAWDLEGTPLTVRVDRIRELALGDERLPPPVDLDVEPRFREALGVLAGGPPLEVRIAVAPEAAEVLAAQPIHPTQRLRRRPDGGAILDLTLSDTPELRAWIRAFGPAMTVLAPEHLARDLAAEAQAVYRRYARRLGLERAASRPARRPARGAGDGGGVEAGSVGDAGGVGEEAGGDAGPASEPYPDA